MTDRMDFNLQRRAAPVMLGGTGGHTPLVK